jgi:hypothetical protein
LVFTIELNLLLFFFFVQNSEEDLTLSQLISESILQPTPVTTHSMEDMIFIQGDVLEEVRQLRRVQEQLLLVERERLLLAKAKFEQKKKGILVMY